MLPGAVVATAQQALLTRVRTLNGLSKNDEMGLHFRSDHYLPIVSGTNFRRNLEFTFISIKKPIPNFDCYPLKIIKLQIV
jgi:hypothetical protein